MRNKEEGERERERWFCVLIWERKGRELLIEEGKPEGSWVLRESLRVNGLSKK